MMQQVNWIEKFGLYSAIIAAGHSVVHTQDGTFADDSTAVQSIIDSFNPLPVAIASQKAAIDTLAAQKRNGVVAGVSPAEMAKWQEKYDQAKNYKLTPVDQTAPDVALEASTRGVSTDSLATKIITKGDALSKLEAQIAGIAGKHADTISAMSDWRTVIAYDFTVGWPV